MFYLYHHHDLEHLSQLLAALRDQHIDSDNLLVPDQVLVPNRGVARWLQIRLASRRGIAANLDFQLPAKFIWHLLSSSLPDTPDSSAYEVSRLRWHLYALLPELAPQLPPVAAYLGDAADALRYEVQRWQLADQLAAVLDEYLIYRRDLLAAWEAGATPDADPGRWQAPLWRALVARLGARHRARLLEEFLQAQRTGRLQRSAWPTRLFCFGLGHLPPDYLRLLYALGQELDVHFLLQNPSDLYWGDIESRPLPHLELAALSDVAQLPGETDAVMAHPLLAAWGRPARDFLRLLYADELAAIAEPQLGELMAYQAPAGNKLLHQVQAGLMRLQPVPAQAGMAAEDDSLQIHACHSPLREVQVLHDQLLDLLARHQDLQPRDVLVMLPDVATYAPYVQSVFGGARGGRRINFSVSDQPRLLAHPICQTFQQLLALPLWRWRLQDVLDLAAVPAVMRQFDLDGADLQRLQTWLSGAGVRWGLDAQQRAALGAGAWVEHSWAFGLDRLLLGVAMQDDQVLVDGVAPWSDLEGNSALALGRLWRLWTALRAAATELASAATAAQWQDRLNALLQTLFGSSSDGALDNDEEQALALLHECISELGAAQQALAEVPLSWPAVRQMLSDELGRSSQAQPFLGGGVHFAGMMPLRALPFRVICLLGLNDGDFPRQDVRHSMNLLQQAPRLGDRSRREDDRLLFLQALLAAGDVFYLSYIGQDLRTGTLRQPSTLVAELLAFLQQYHFAGANTAERDATQRLLSWQPMQPFSPRYLQAAAPQRIFSFHQAWFAQAPGTGDKQADMPFADGSQLPPEAAPQSLSLDTLKAFVRHPLQFFFRDQLQLHLPNAEEGLADEESWTLERLERHSLRAQLLQRLQSGQALPEAPDALLRAQALLPPAPLDGPAYAQQLPAIQQLHELVGNWDEPAQGMQVNLMLGAVQVHGRVPDISAQGIRRYRAGDMRLEYQLPHWVDFLACKAQGHAGDMQLAGISTDDKVQLFQFQIEQDAAIKALTALAQAARDAHRRPLWLLPALAEKFVEAKGFDLEKPAPETALERARYALKPSDYHESYVAKDPYVQLMDTSAEAFQLGAEPHQLLETLIKPLVRHRSALDAGEATP